MLKVYNFYDYESRDYGSQDVWVIARSLSDAVEAFRKDRNQEVTIKPHPLPFMEGEWQVFAGKRQYDLDVYEYQENFAYH